MQKLIESIHQFQSESFVPLQGLFERLAKLAAKRRMTVDQISTDMQSVYAALVAAFCK